VTPFWSDDHLTLYGGDCRAVLAELPAESVHCVVTSPPYWGLRDYGVSDQLGLEPTPEAYVENMVAVFREVRRVVRHDATVWLNVGDSYMSEPYEPWGLKAKDAALIPHRLAMALQAPYYTGRIKREADRIWLAAMVDAEGCIHVHRRPAGSSAHSTYTKKDGTVSDYVRKADTFGAMVSVDNTSRAIIDRCASIFGQGSRYTDEAGSGVQQRKQTLYRWTVTGNQARELLRELYPYLVAKQQQARIAIGSPSSGGHDAQEAIKALHAGREVTLDYPAPASLNEQGWYVRSDIVWGKSNPMPESVTDRPTKAHEYLFLLSKSPRYYFDADAVREAVSPHTLVAYPNGPGGGGGYKGDGANDARTRTGFAKAAKRPVDTSGRNLRSVWTIATEPYPGAHFATFPRKLVEPCVKAGTSERGVCPECGAPWVRVVERERVALQATYNGAIKTEQDMTPNGVRWGGSGVPSRLDVTTTGWRSSCAHTAEPVPAVVLDPFAGSGTALLVAQALGRRGVGIDLNPDYLKQALARNAQTPLGLVG
jgi:DNA modification methylase